MSYADRIKETATTTGTGAFTLAGAVTGFKTFASRLTVGDRVAYCIEGQTPGEWEIGIGTLSGSTTLTRTHVSASSNADALVNFSVGTKNVFVTATASQLVDGLVDPADAGYDVVLCAGQSNMVGRGTIDTLADMVDSRVMQFGGASAQARYRTIFSGASPTHNAETLQTTASPQSAFGNAYAAIRPSNRKVLLVPCAYGGTTIVHPSFNGFVVPPWSSGTPGGDLYENAITQANLAITAAQAVYPNSRFVGVIWHQGESDADNSISQAAYTAALTATIAGFRARITGASASWFVIGGMMPERIASVGAAYNAIVSAHQQVASAVDKCMYVAGPTGFQADTWHFTAAGSRVLGTSMALAVRAAQHFVAVDVAAPTASSAAVANATPTYVDITLAEAMDTNFTPAFSSVTVSGHTVSALVYFSSTVLRATVDAFVNGEAARTAAYTQPGANNARDLAGNLLANFSALAITNNVIGAATAVSMSGPSGGVELVASTNFTLGVTPLTGTIAGTLAVTPADGGAGGTFTPTSVNLTTGTPTGTFTYTPASTGAKTISVTNNGGLTNPGNITYTATASATAPGAPTIGTATAGDTTASVTFTAPGSDGGSAITGYTATSSPGGLTGTGASSPITVSGLTNATAYTFTVTATNAIGTGAASAASNSVTPAAAAYATWNPADKNADLTLTNSDKTITGRTNNTSNWCAARSTISKTTGKWYWEVTVGVGVHVIGVGVAGDALTNFPGFSANGVGYYSAASIFRNNVHVGSGSTATYTAGDVIGVAYDADNETVGFTKNGVQVSTTAMYAVPAGTLFAVNATRENGTAATTTTNFGASAFAYTPPTGHVGLA